MLKRDLTGISYKNRHGDNLNLPVAVILISDITLKI